MEWKSRLKLSPFVARRRSRVCGASRSFWGKSDASRFSGRSSWAPRSVPQTIAAAFKTIQRAADFAQPGTRPERLPADWGLFWDLDAAGTAEREFLMDV